MLTFLFAVGAVLIVVIEELFIKAQRGTGMLGFPTIVIPIGAFFVACIVGGIIAYGEKLSGKRNKLRVVILAFLVGIVLYPLVCYMDYYMAHTEVSFLDYEKSILENVKCKVGKQATLSVKFEVALIGTVVLQFICMLCVPLAALSALKNFKYCKSCKKYYKKKMMFDIPSEKYVEATFLENMKNKEWLAERYKERRPREYYEVFIIYCPVCKKGEIVLEYHDVSYKNVRREEKDKKFTVESVMDYISIADNFDKLDKERIDTK